MAFGVSFTEKTCPVANITEDPEDLKLVDPNGRTVPRMYQHQFFSKLSNNILTIFYVI